ncbi:MAG TPA: hypothetical protein VGM56_04315 [Byssovorax sp.]|jgi:hypothetical protein
MSGPRAALGDSHNFGRRVELRGDRVVKPRTVLWEWLFLSAASPLRRALDRAANHAGSSRDAFAFLPDLAFSRPDARGGGEVERVVLAPLPRASAASRRALAEIVGRATALFTWLGVGDLHWENLALGLDAGGRVTFAPLDVEIVLSDLASPTETKLLPEADPEVAEVCRHACGVRRALHHLGKPVDGADVVAMASAYLATLALLDADAPAIAAAISSVPGLREAPIRVCLRGTDAYVRARSEPVWPPLLDAEQVQLARGDIPYFFRLYGRAGIHFYAEPTLALLARLPTQGDVPRLDPMLQLGRGLRAPSRRKLREEGLFTLLGAFDHEGITGRVSGDGHSGSAGLEVTFGARSLVVKPARGDELRCRRDLRAFVGSVYLPCRCGEVRAALVPRVTRCDALA